MDDVYRTLRQLYESTPVLVAAYDGFDRLRYANSAFRSAFFIKDGETPFWPDLMRRNFMAGRGTVIRNDDFEAWLTGTLARRGKTSFRAFETDLVGGRWLWMTETVQKDGWMLCIASDITSLRADEREIRQERDFALKAASTDDLTGAVNRRFAMGRLADMLRQEEEDERFGCLAVLDLDHFKLINDRYGHNIGDLVLRDFTSRIQSQLRRTDCFGRLGGEEFGLVLPHTTIRQAQLLVERMLVIVRRSRPLIERPDMAYTFSAGIAAGRFGDSVADLYARADAALYAAKRSGRNCTFLEDTEPGQSTVSG
ncbi:diguanylate cyclase [Acuticoccus sediminis]|uniref:diguanylate cyclase n=1 Tax=Acuticoccus sediminis TaxID=2184697 RepID=A0A8B2NZ19_9HYPH|nr:GGDEF domain-containing protein [Acuticoccus sediminis]RAI01810.1 diguanylate cyclase [Acuticoccus sediminis]